MKKSMKAALLSALVFPGVGHFFLKRPVGGLILTGGTCAAFYILMSRLVERALAVTEKIQNGEVVQLDFASLLQLMVSQAPGTEAQVLNLASVVAVLLWLVAIVDAYLIGREQDDVKGSS